MKKIDEITFRSPINSETSYGSTQLSDDTESIMTLYIDEDDDDKYAYIDWEVPELDEYAGIGIYCHGEPKVISDYDGVFEVPKQAIELLKKNGFNTDYLTD